MVLDEHLAQCEPCRSMAVELEPPAHPAAPAEAAWTDLVARIEAEQAPSAGLRVALQCSFCHDQLSGLETVYCASCLAPHHDDCHRTHTRCSAPGCDGRLTVRAGGGKELRRGRGRRGWFVAVGGVAAVAALSTAALVSNTRGGPSSALGETTVPTVQIPDDLRKGITRDEVLAALGNADHEVKEEKTDELVPVPSWELSWRVTGARTYLNTAGKLVSVVFHGQGLRPDGTKIWAWRGVTIGQPLQEALAQLGGPRAYPRTSDGLDVYYFPEHEAVLYTGPDQRVCRLRIGGSPPSRMPSRGR